MLLTFYSPLDHLGHLDPPLLHALALEYDHAELIAGLMILIKPRKARSSRVRNACLTADPVIPMLFAEQLIRVLPPVVTLFVVESPCAIVASFHDLPEAGDAHACATKLADVSHS